MVAPGSVSHTSRVQSGPVWSSPVCSVQSSSVQSIKSSPVLSVKSSPVCSVHRWQWGSAVQSEEREGRDPAAARGCHRALELNIDTVPSPEGLRCLRELAVWPPCWKGASPVTFSPSFKAKQSSIITRLPLRLLHPHLSTVVFCCHCFVKCEESTLRCLI